jgi:hypothetical protein
MGCTGSLLRALQKGVRKSIDFPGSPENEPKESFSENNCALLAKLVSLPGNLNNRWIG